MKRTIISDLDGTISNYEHRAHLYNDLLYSEFNKAGADDPPIENICNILRALKDDETEIIILTARDESCRAMTLKWLELNDIPCDQLYMRPLNDTTSDHITKENLYKNNLSDRNVWFVLEDRAVCVDMWRALGLSCLAVKEVNNVHKS